MRRRDGCVGAQSDNIISDNGAVTLRTKLVTNVHGSRNYRRKDDAQPKMGAGGGQNQRVGLFCKVRTHCCRMLHKVLHKVRTHCCKKNGLSAWSSISKSRSQRMRSSRASMAISHFSGCSSLRS